MGDLIVNDSVEMRIEVKWNHIHFILESFVEILDNYFERKWWYYLHLDFQIRKKMSVEEESVENVETSGDADKIVINGTNGANGNEKKSTSKDFEISSKFLQSVFKKDDETEDKVWKVESSDLPAFVQVVRISKERNDSQAFR